MSKPKREDKLELFDYNFPEDRQYSQGNKNQEYYNRIKIYNEEKRKANTARTIEKAIFWSFAIAAILVTVFSIYLLKSSLEDSSSTLPQDNKIIVGSANLSTTLEEQQSKVPSTTTKEEQSSTTISTSEVQQVIPTVKQTSTTTSVLAQSSTTTSETTIEDQDETESTDFSKTTSTTVKQTTTTQHSETEKPSKTTAKPTTQNTSQTTKEEPNKTTTEPTTSKQEYVYHVRFYIKSTKTNKVLGYYTSEMSEAEVSKVYKFANEQLAAESLDGETGTYYIVEEEYKVQK